MCRGSSTVVTASVSHVVIARVLCTVVFPPRRPGYLYHVVPLVRHGRASEAKWIHGTDQDVHAYPFHHC